MAALTQIKDYYVLVQTDGDTFEEHAGLDSIEAAKLTTVLGKMRGVTSFVVEESQPEWYTIGFPQTIAQIVDDLDLGREGLDDD